MQPRLHVGDRFLDQRLAWGALGLDRRGPTVERAGDRPRHPHVDEDREEDDEPEQCPQRCVEHQLFLPLIAALTASRISADVTLAVESALITASAVSLAILPTSP